MDIVVTHVTRMQGNHVCVAGQRSGDDVSVRPVLQGARLPRSAVAPEGPFWAGHRVDVGPTTPCGAPPETEDHAFLLANAWLAGQENPAAFWRLLKRCARPRFADIFGPALQDVGATAALPEGQGGASLGILRPSEPPSLDVFGTSVKLHVSDGERQLRVAVTDIRLYRADGALDAEMFNGLAEKLRREPCFLAVGVSRPWRKPEDALRRHWLQVNGIHFPSGPSWS